MLAAQVYLSSYLEPLAPWLSQSDVTDIFINGPGEIWVEVLGHPPERIEVPSLTRSCLARMARQIAAFGAQGISREHPLLAASLPDGSRVQIVLPPATRGEIAIAIRRHISAGMSLGDYSEAGAFAETTGSQQASLSAMSPAGGGDAAAQLREAVRAKRNILISGGTSTGKTTFLNALLNEVPSDERLILIEDTPELQLTHPNGIGLLAARGHLGEAEVSAEDLLIAALRMRPDRIILGEMRGGEALTFLRAINTGHPGSLSTVHADSPEGAIDQLTLLVLQAGTRMEWDDVARYIRRSVDLIVQLKRSGGKRSVERLVFVKDMAG
jgi:type IV secretion system protein VirB11